MMGWGLSFLIGANRPVPTSAPVERSGRTSATALAAGLTNEPVFDVG